MVIRGERILAVGQQGDLRLPPNSKVYKFPQGHVYPGLIDASTDAFTDNNLRRDTKLNGGSKVADGLVWTDSRDDHLIKHGITTAYVAVRTPSPVRGQGAIVRPRANSFELWGDGEETALQLRMTNGPGASHALQRQSQLAFAGRLFEPLEKYREANEKYEEALEKYEADFEKYLEYHSKKNGKDKKGVDRGAQDVTAIAFDDVGVTYVGSATYACRPRTLDGPCGPLPTRRGVEPCTPRLGGCRFRVPSASTRLASANPTRDAQTTPRRQAPRRRVAAPIRLK